MAFPIPPLSLSPPSFSLPLLLHLSLFCLLDDTASVSSHLSVSLDVIMSFAAVQLVVLTLTILLQVTILVTWTKWRKRKAILSGIANSTQPARATEFPPPPPSYSESSSNSVLLESGRETNTPLPLPPADN